MNILEIKNLSKTYHTLKNEINALENIANYNNASGANLLGIHLEGPFISPAFSGALWHCLTGLAARLLAWCRLLKRMSFAIRQATPWQWWVWGHPLHLWCSDSSILRVLCLRWFSLGERRTKIYTKVIAFNYKTKNSSSKINLRFIGSCLNF